MAAIGKIFALDAIITMLRGKDIWPLPQIPIRFAAAAVFLDQALQGQTPRWRNPIGGHPPFARGAYPILQHKRLRVAAIHHRRAGLPPFKVRAQNNRAIHILSHNQNRVFLAKTAQDTPRLAIAIRGRF